MTKYYFLDTETTTNDTKYAEVVEIGVYFPTENGWQKFEERCKPFNKITIGAMATHHITPKMLENAPRFRDTEVYKWLKENTDAVLIAHNAPYDTAVLSNEAIQIPENRIIDTLNVAKHILTDENIESYSLQYLRYFYDLDQFNENDELPATMAHSAMYDTVVLKWLFEFLSMKIRKLHPGRDVIDEMIRLSTLPVLLQKISFGKYRGKSFEDIYAQDKGYLEWLSRNTDDKNIFATCEYWLTRNNIKPSDGISIEDIPF